jgi:TRAP-type C4-dicarboxylate transport system permease small subunit
MSWLTAVNTRLSRWAMYIAVAGLIGIVAVVVSSVFWRYVLNDSPIWSEQVALLLAITVAMFGGSAGVRDEGHIGLESLIGFLPEKQQFWIGSLVGVITVVFGVALGWGALNMGIAVKPNAIPTLGISEFYRYLPCIVAGVLIVSFSIEHLIAMFTNKKVVPSWH